MPSRQGFPLPVSSRVDGDPTPPPFSWEAPRIFQPNPTAENRHRPRSFWGGHHQNDRLRCRRFPCLVALRYKLKLISYALRLYSCYPPYWRVPIRLVLGRGWKGWGYRGGAIPLAEAVELVMGMKRVPHRVAPHNALRAGSHRVRLSVQPFLVLHASNVGSRVYRKPHMQIPTFLYRVPLTEPTG